MELLDFRKKPSHLTLLFVALAISSISLLIIYPGVMYSDSYNRIAMAQQIEAGQNGFRQYLTILPSIFIAILHFITNNYAAYTLAQAVFFLWTTLEAFFLFCNNTIFSIFSFVVLSPILIGYSLYWETGPVVAATLIWLLILDRCSNISDKKSEKIFRSALYFVAYFLCCFVITGYRINAATAIVGVVIWNLFFCLREKRIGEFFKKCTFAILGILVAIMLPSVALGIQSGNNMGVGMLWETACVINRIGPGNGYDTYLDDVIGEGNTEKVFAVENPEDSMYSFSDAYDFFGAVINDHGAIMDRYLNIIQENPAQFCKVKLKIIGNTLTRADFAEYDKDRDGKMKTYGFSDTERRNWAIDAVTQYMNTLVPLRIPIFLFGVALVLLIVCLFLHIQALPLMEAFFVACCYEGGYFITTQAYEFRYFFPAWLVLILVILGSISKIGGALYTKKCKSI